LSQEERVRRISLSSAQSVHRASLGQESAGFPRWIPATQSFRPSTSLPPCTQPVQLNLTSDEVEALQKKGSLWMPGKNIYISVGPSTSKVKLEEARNTSAAVLTPPPDKDAFNSSPASSLPSERLRLSEEGSTPASDFIEESTAPGRPPFHDHIGNLITNETVFDDDFGNLFDLDAGIEFLAVDGKEGRMSPFEDGTIYRPVSVEPKLHGLSTTEMKPGMSGERQHGCLISDSEHFRSSKIR
jgi:hypothetical protein